MVNFPIKKQQSTWYPFSDIQNLHQEMDRLFDLTFPRWDSEGLSLASQWSPAIDVYDSKDNMIIKADLPGLTKNDINVSVQDDLLTITGEKKQESETKEKNCLKTERFYGSFHRTLKLPAAIDLSKVNANFKDGVLEITFGKKEEAKPKQIAIDVK